MALPITEAQVAGKRFRYKTGARSSRRMTLRSDYRLEGSPSLNEHSWAIEEGKLVLRHRNGRKTLEFTRTGNWRFDGSDFTENPHGKASLVEDWRQRFPRLRQWMKEVRLTLQPHKRSRAAFLTHEQLLENSIAVRRGSRTIRWLFQTGYMRDEFDKQLLQWVWPGCEKLPATASADFHVGTWLDRETVTGSFAELPGMKFLLSIEKETRFPRLPNCWSFVQNPLATDDLAYTRYAMPFVCWSPPRETPKTKKCSVVDNGQYIWRAEMIEELSKKIGDVDIFGKLAGKRLGGYHGRRGESAINEKYLGIEAYAFYLSLERAIADDYLTEKFTDAIMCNAVPIYDGAPNAETYAIPESFIRAADVGKIDWKNWQGEYAKRASAVAAQKEILRTRLNLFAYFDLLTSDLSLLDKVRPITR